VKYKYWKQGMTVPKSLPKDCQYFSNGTWHDEYVEPNQWEITDRRWPTGKKSARRPSKHERLLKALLSVCTIDDSLLDGKALMHRGRRVHIFGKVNAELIAIKESMDKKARKA